MFFQKNRKWDIERNYCSLQLINVQIPPHYGSLRTMLMQKDFIIVWALRELGGSTQLQIKLLKLSCH